MSIDVSGASSKLKSTNISIEVNKNHRLILLANSLPLTDMVELVVEDLKNTTAKGFFNRGRRLVVRIHLMIFILQKIFDYTDRKVIALVRENAVYQVFCGYDVVEKWFIPVPQKIEEFRNRLSPDTQRQLSNLIAKSAVELGLGFSETMDIDSTTQEANMSYPSDANLMVKLGKKMKTVIDWVKGHTRGIVPKDFEIDLTDLLSKGKGYFFQAHNIAKEKRKEAFRALHEEAKKVVYSGLEVLSSLDSRRIKELPWNIKLSFDQIMLHGKRYILDVAHYARTSTMKAGKTLSFHLEEVACLTKGKNGKKREFGREFQIGKIGGNFVVATAMESIRTNDKTAIPPMIDLHQELFGKGNLKSLSGDRGYCSKTNEQCLSEVIDDFHLGYRYVDQAEEDYHRLYNRRSGIEPIIGHIKQGGQLGKSRMKSDTATHAAGYAAMLGFNLRQIMNRQENQ